MPKLEHLVPKRLRKEETYVFDYKYAQQYRMLFGEFDKQIIDFTQNPQDLIDRIRDLDPEQSLDNKLIKIEGKIAGLKKRSSIWTRPRSGLDYRGFISIEDKFQLYFDRSIIEGRKDSLGYGDLRVAEMILEAGKDTPITIIGTFLKDMIVAEVPYGIMPQVLQLGDYTSPTLPRG